MTALLERERELAKLDELVAAARAGTGCVAVIEAAAGLGKTRLLQAARGVRPRSRHARALCARDGAGAGLPVRARPPAVRAGARGARRASARGAARRRGRRVARRARDRSGRHARRAGSRRVRGPARPVLADRRARGAAAAAARGRRRALVRRGLARLPRLSRAAAGGAARAAGAHVRPDEAGAERSLARIATDSLARRLTPLALSPQGAAALLAEELEREPEEAFAATCHEVSGGNPFLLLRAGAHARGRGDRPAAEQASRVHELAPERVTRTVHVRLARLSPEARAVARAVVVLGDDADGRLAAELAGLDEAVVARAADELRAAAILDPAAARCASSIRSCARRSTQSCWPASARRRTRARWSCCAHTVRARSGSRRISSRPRLAASARRS